MNSKNILLNKGAFLAALRANANNFDNEDENEVEGDGRIEDYVDT